MALIRLQNKVPEVYPTQSRDFQTLCRAFDLVINGVKYDIDSMKYLTDTLNFRTHMLRLLQTKIGFFTHDEYNDETIRYVLRAFPDIVKNKGSLKAIKQAINVFLKINGINTQTVVSLTKNASKLSGNSIKANTLIIGFNASVKDTTILGEMLRYIMPAGFDYYMYFYKGVSPQESINFFDNAELLFVTDSRSAQIRRDDKEFDTDMKNRRVGSYDAVEIVGLEGNIIYPQGSHPDDWDSNVVDVVIGKDNIDE